jgi:hypothetical protein
MQETIYFKEKQQFRQWWLWLILIFVGGDGIWTTMKSVQAGPGFSFDKNVLPFLVLLIPAAVIFFMLYARLETEIKSDGIYVRFFPIHRRFRFYPWAELDNVYVRQYSPLGEYGGWGLRGLGGNKALNISGNKGLQLILKNGDRMLIGTRKPEEIEQVLISIPGLKTTSQK